MYSFKLNDFRFPLLFMAHVWDCSSKMRTFILLLFILNLSKHVCDITYMKVPEFPRVIFKLEAYQVRLVYNILRNDNWHRDLQGNISNFQIFNCNGSSTCCFNSCKIHAAWKHNILNTKLNALSKNDGFGQKTS